MGIRLVCDVCANCNQLQVARECKGIESMAGAAFGMRKRENQWAVLFINAVQSGAEIGGHEADPTNGDGVGAPSSMPNVPDSGAGFMSRAGPPELTKTCQDLQFQFRSSPLRIRSRMAPDACSAVVCIATGVRTANGVFMLLSWRPSSPRYREGAISI